MLRPTAGDTFNGRPNSSFPVGGHVRWPLIFTQIGFWKLHWFTKMYVGQTPPANDSSPPYHNHKVRRVYDVS